MEQAVVLPGKTRLLLVHGDNLWEMFRTLDFFESPINSIAEKLKTHNSVFLYSNNICNGYIFEPKDSPKKNAFSVATLIHWMQHKGVQNWLNLETSFFNFVYGNILINFHSIKIPDFLTLF